MLSLVIPSRGEAQGLWSTVASAHDALKATGEQYEIWAVVNGKVPDLATWMFHEGTCNVLWSGADSPQMARDQGLKQSRGEFVFFADAHCVFPRDYFSILLEDAERTKADAIFGGTRFCSNPTYGMKVGWNEYLWGQDVVYKKHIDERGDGPAPIGIIGHGAFGIRRKAYMDAGGYWLALHGFGGEETQFNFKLWMMGFRCFVTPRVYHWHYLPFGERHGFDIHSNRDFVRNFLMIAAAYGGEQRVRESYNAFQAYYWQGKALHPELPAEVLAAEEVAAERAFIREHAVYKDLNALREMFVREGVIA